MSTENHHTLVMDTHSYLAGLIKNSQDVLDVGGTGRLRHYTTVPVTDANIKHGVSGEKLPYGDSSFDTVASIVTLEHVSGKKAFIDESYRVANRQVVHICPMGPAATTVEAFKRSIGHKHPCTIPRLCDIRVYCAHMSYTLVPLSTIREHVLLLSTLPKNMDKRQELCEYARKIPFGDIYMYALIIKKPHPMVRKPYKMKTLLVSYYTDEKGSSAYKDKASRLRQRCEELGIESYIVPIPYKGSWRANTLYKPKFLLDVIKKFNRPVFWLDADNRILKPLSLIDGLICDVAAADMPKNKGLQVRVGTLYFNNTNKAKAFLTKWLAVCKNSKWSGDHQPFSKTWSNTKKDGSARLYTLPGAYSCNAVTDATVIHVGRTKSKSKDKWSADRRGK